MSEKLRELYEQFNPKNSDDTLCPETVALIPFGGGMFFVGSEDEMAKLAAVNWSLISILSAQEHVFGTEPIILDVLDCARLEPNLVGLETTHMAELDAPMASFCEPEGLSPAA